MAIIGSLMKTNMVTAAPSTTIAEAARTMAKNGVGAILVVEGDEIRGIVSERDVMSRVVAEGKDPAQTKVSDVATAEVVSVDVHVHVRECAKLLRDQGIRHLPVTQDGKAAGILSSRDFFAYVVEGLERFIDRARYEEKLDKGEDPYDHLGGSYGR
ncbi:MAG: CBS domain-containing protein [Myxococcales bacterium]|jgi:CBS domain-containing protein